MNFRNYLNLYIFTFIGSYYTINELVPLLQLSLGICTKKSDLIFNICILRNFKKARELGGYINQINLGKYGGRNVNL